MNRKKTRLLLLIIILTFGPFAFAQNDTQPEQQNSDNSPIQNTPVLKVKPIHNFVLPRRKTYLRFNRFQEKVDIDQKLKESNKLLY